MLLASFALLLCASCLLLALQRRLRLAHPPAPVWYGAIAETPQLRERIAELENRVKQLEDELARDKARK